MPEPRSRQSILDQVFQNERGVDVLDSLAVMSASDLDELPFGAIRLDRNGRVLSFNQTESQYSGLSAESVIGKSFFTDVAPCTNVQRFAGSFYEGVARRKLHVVFPFHFQFKTKPRDVTVTLYYHQPTDTIWVLVRG